LIRSLLRRVGLFYAVLCGIAVTWAAAAFGLALLTPHWGCHLRVPHLKTARYLTAETASAVQVFRIVENHCPTRDALVSRNYVDAKDLVDPWGTSITFQCTAGGDVVVRSAGPDRLFHTPDDVTNDD
jgi:hypothetical protein